ncbi:glycosyltransferase family 4 protein [Guptibacillus hwajinpoensis]|uniref:Glycosyl transferase n=1 Tax=Guptibacillus hwajinpoensis TaxID=208199 RepID=A0A0J6CKI1_9BACL|nr:glycosyltransferase family 4 protein [Alkalihalobacillus macyae]KMM36746.1 hypothetical protein AB986_12455 [Alkalihalobacillus macyae]
MRRVLMLASVSSMLDQFNMPNIKLLQEMGYKVDVACNMKEGNTSSEQRVNDFKEELRQLNIDYFQIDFARNITKVRLNVTAYKQLKKLLQEKKYNFIHCHSPIGGVIGRLVSRSTRTKVIYTAHGFHFFKSAPLINWLLYYPIEHYLSKYTDILITINKEDHDIANKKFKAKDITYIPGIGIDTKKFGGSSIDRESKRTEMGVASTDTVLLSVGELIERKNHSVVIKALAKLANPNVKYYICGRGQLEAELIKLAKDNQVEDQVFFLGYRTDVSDIYKAADLFVFPSLQEGLPVALMEAISTGLPVVASKIRGNTDLISNGEGGFLVSHSDVHGYVIAIEKVMSDYSLKEQFKNRNVEYIKKFELVNVQKIMKTIYSRI